MYSVIVFVIAAQIAAVSNPDATALNTSGQALNRFRHGVFLLLGAAQTNTYARHTIQKHETRQNTETSGEAKHRNTQLVG